MTTALSFWKWAVGDETNLLERIFEALDASGVRYCVVGGVAMNAYAEPVITLDLDIAVATDDIEAAIAALGPTFSSREFEHSINLSSPPSKLQVQIQRDERYAAFPERAERRWVNDLFVPVASPEDLLAGKIWAASDPKRRVSKRLKDFADIRRLVDEFPHLQGFVPDEIRRNIEL